MSRPMPPSDLDAERYVMAAMMNSAEAIEPIAEILEAEDFYRPAHQVLFLTMVTMWAAREPIDPVTLKDRLERDGEVRILGGQWTYLSDLYGLPVSGNGAYHARIVREKSIRRHLIETATRITQLAYQVDADPAETLARAEAEVGQVITKAAVQNTLDELASVAMFCTRDYSRLEPVIPGLLDHEDRTVIVGLEGDGKSTLLRQMAMCVGCGVHPFMWTPIKPMRALIIDLENPRALLQRSFKRLQEVASRQPGFNPGNVMVWAHPGGLDLSSAHDAYLLADVVRRAKPNLIVGGPLYKMIKDKGDSSEQTHSVVTNFWDSIRQRHGCALVLETHVPITMAGGKGRAMRPLGSGIWSRWPEFGLTLGRSGKSDGVFEIGRFRGDREEGRMWPVKVSRNRTMGNHWPWIATYPDGTLMDPIA